jgi:hypothetical protein
MKQVTVTADYVFCACRNRTTQEHVIGLLRACPFNSFFDAEWAEIEVFNFRSDRLQAGRISPERLKDHGSVPQFHLEVPGLGDLTHDFFGDRNLIFAMPPLLLGCTNFNSAI